MRGITPGLFLFGSCAVALTTVANMFVGTIHRDQHYYRSLIQGTAFLAVISLLLAVVYFLRTDGNKRFLAFLPAMAVAACVVLAFSYSLRAVA
jgi:hypothetical protein